MVIITKSLIIHVNFILSIKYWLISDGFGSVVINYIINILNYNDFSLTLILSFDNNLA